MLRRKYARYLLRAIGGFAIVATALPFIKTDQWWIRVFDFPRLQVLTVGSVAAAFFLISRPTGRVDRSILGILCVALGAQAWQVVPYTPIARKQVKVANGVATLKIFVANVLQENRNAEKLLAQIRARDPDIILLNETDEWWTKAMSELQKSHPHTVLHPRTNTYGMNFYSRLELSDSEVRFLTDPRVPSIRTKLHGTNDSTVWFYGVHPRPPAIKREERDERQDSAQRDAELVVMAKEIRRLSGPVVVAGDFNDVAWSHTTRLFQRISQLLDPRVGRGLYNTYNVKTPLFRYPLDHLFHSETFTLVDIERLDDFGSDHFPIFAALRLEPAAAGKQEAPEPKESDSKEAQEILNKEPD
jgi:endonuclease/exonuclease/phosphatase (EEP) superfamily protein YafD